MIITFKSLLGGIFAVSIAVLPARAAVEEPSTFFEEQIRPILASKCVKCHGEAKQKGDLRLDSRAALLHGGENGAAVLPGSPDESRLIQAVRYQGLEMPPDAPLPEAEVQLLAAWVAAGATWPEHSGEIRAPKDGISAADKAWWAFQPVVKPDVPASGNESWAANPIDHFVRARQQEAEISPAPEAEKATLVRRLYVDVLGIPPTPDEIDAYLSDGAPDAWARLVDRLLDDPRYGEHWAQFWLDLVRYAESDGWNQDAYRPQIWRYRDYVVNAFNSDKPYTDFVREQLAGDEVPDQTPEDITATGYLRLGIYEYNQRNAADHWNSIMNEITDVTGNVFLGLSMSCSRCHDHKFDPIPQTDYFSLRAFFEPIVWNDDVIAATNTEQAAWHEKDAAWEAASADVRARIETLVKPYYESHAAKVADMFPLDIQACYHKPAAERTSWEAQMAYLVSRQTLEEGGGPLKKLSKDDKATYDALQEELAAFKELKPAPLPIVMAASDHTGSLSPTLMPDDPQHKPIEPRFLTVLASNPVKRQPDLPEVAHSSGRRTALAEWIGNPQNPLTVRVIVNRIWQQHFGEGIVPSASDFGHLGQPPTHPELLDWLTAEFIEHGWQFKHLHRLILNSATWRQSSMHPQAEANQAKDPGEVLLWRARVRRMSSEELRDAMLQASGELDRRLGGPSVDAKTPRRGLYVKRIRNTPEAMLAAFDAADGITSVSQRNTTTTPTQALMLINGDYTLGRATKFAERVLSGSPANREAALVHAFRVAWGRAPSEAELAHVLDFLGPPLDGDGIGMDRAKFVDICHVLLNSNEFMYVD